MKPPAKPEDREKVEEQKRRPEGQPEVGGKGRDLDRQEPGGGLFGFATRGFRKGREFRKEGADRRGKDPPRGA